MLIYLLCMFGKYLYILQICPGVHIITILVPILIKLLESKISRDLHDQCLQQLLQIASEMPIQFKQIIAMAPSLKLTLESAIKVSFMYEEEACL